MRRTRTIGLMVVCLILGFVALPAGATHSGPAYLGYIGPTWGTQYPYYAPIPANTTNITITPSDWVSGQAVQTVSSFHNEYNHSHTDCSYGSCTTYDHLHREQIGVNATGCGQRTVAPPSGANRIRVYATLGLACSYTGPVYGTITLNWH